MVSANSQHFVVKSASSSKGKEYRVTINFDSGHWCDCRGMISMKGRWGHSTGRTVGTSCRHVRQIIKTEFNDDWGTKITGGGGSRVAPSGPSVTSPPASSKPTGRRALIAATRAKREQKRLAEAQSAADSSSLQDRIAALRASANEGATS